MRRSLPVVIAALCTAAAIPAAAAGRAFETYTVVDVAEGVFTFVAPEANAGLVSGNSTVVVGDGGLLVFDTGNFPSLTRRMVADLKKRTGLPVKYVVNSHWHFDHANGNPVYEEAYPGAVFVSTTFTRDRLAALFQKYSKDQADLIRTEIPNVKKLLEKGVKRDGKTPLSAQDRAYYEELLVDMKGAEPEYRAGRLVLPSVTFDESLTLHLGKREVKLMHLGRGNTAGDAMAYVPDVKVLISGDVLVLPTPFGFGSYPAEWIAVLKKIDAMSAAVIVPGHGPIQRDTSYVKTLAALIESIRAQMKPLAEQGLPLEEARKKMDLAAFRGQLAGADVGRGRAFDFFFAQPFLDRAYQEAKGVLAPEE